MLTGSTGGGSGSGMLAVAGRRRQPEHVAQLVALDHFLFEQALRQFVEDLAVL